MEHETIWQQCKSNEKKILKKKAEILQFIEAYNTNEVTAWLGLQENYRKVTQ